MSGTKKVTRYSEDSYVGEKKNQLRHGESMTMASMLAV